MEAWIINVSKTLFVSKKKKVSSRSCVLALVELKEENT